MPREAKGIRLWLRRRDGRSAIYVIRDGSKQISTGCLERDLEGAEEALKAHLARRHTPQRRGAATTISDVLKLYGDEHGPYTARPGNVAAAIDALEPFWGEKTLADVSAKTCRDYVAWRMPQRNKCQGKHPGKARRGATISANTARLELEYLQAAIRYCAKEHDLPLRPVALPPKAERAHRWLTRSEAARLVLAAWRNPRTRHIARFVLVALYTGTRKDAILRLRWRQHEDGGHFDLERGFLHRKAAHQPETKKRRPTCRIPTRLLPHLRRWRRRDGELAHVVHYQGRPIEDIQDAFATAALAARVENCTPHTLRHTCATWLMQEGIDPWDAAGFLGMSLTTLVRVYGAWHPSFQHKSAEASWRGSMAGR